MTRLGGRRRWGVISGRLRGPRMGISIRRSAMGRGLESRPQRTRAGRIVFRWGWPGSKGDAGIRRRECLGREDSENAAQLRGKGTGIISVGGVLYMWVAGPESLTVPETQLAVSRDLSKTWSHVDWKWTMRDRLFAGASVNHGKDDAGAKDEYVYSCFTRLATVLEKPRNWTHEVPGQVDLARVPRSKIIDQAAWEWFAGVDDRGRPGGRRISRRGWRLLRIRTGSRL